MVKNIAAFVAFVVVAFTSPVHAADVNDVEAVKAATKATNAAIKAACQDPAKAAHPVCQERAMKAHAAALKRAAKVAEQARALGLPVAAPVAPSLSAAPQAMKDRAAEVAAATCDGSDLDCELKERAALRELMAAASPAGRF